MKTSKKLFMLGAILSSLAFSQPSHALITVIDKSVLAETIRQLSEMKRQYDLLRQQYDELVATKNAITGSYGMSLLENGILQEKGRRTLPATWQEVVNLQKTGVIPGIYAEKSSQFEKLLPTIDSKLFSKNSSNRNATSYKLSTDNTRAAFASTEAVYNQIQNRLKTIESLTKQIDQTDNVKAATDLNSRISAENGFLSIEMARLQSLQLSLQTTLQNNQNQATANHAEFFGKPFKSSLQ